MQRVLREIADVIGLPACLELVSRWGGRDLYVPEHIDRMHPIAFAIGLEAAQKLAAEYPRCTLSLPIERNATIDLRNALIYQEWKDGASKQRLSLRWGLTRPGIDAVLAKMQARENEPQETAAADLFSDQND
ncbi:Mor transcription activator family protein [Methyloversatilis sp.]|uniref:Mor transcription activator family protein n=1 Tax=Methyloversatilis sp. TaxID=2569862 RepID=UPI003D28A942